MKQPSFVASNRFALVAWCMVLLQLVTALHFALVPHGFSAGLRGFEHLHALSSAERSVAAEARLAREHQSMPALAPGGASCANESCPIGFAGHHSLLVANCESSALLSFSRAPAHAPPSFYLAARGLILLSAPKTSPPC